MNFTSSTHRVAFAPEIYALLDKMYQRSAEERRETLAALVGHYSDDCTTAVVDGIICQVWGEYAICERDHVRLKTELDEIWKSSDGKRYFLGEWHTHPGEPNTPSVIDLATASDTAHDPKANCPQLVMAISGSDGLGVHVVTADVSVQLGVA